MTRHSTRQRKGKHHTHRSIYTSKKKEASHTHRLIYTSSVSFYSSSSSRPGKCKSTIATKEELFCCHKNKRENLLRCRRRRVVLSSRGLTMATASRHYPTGAQIRRWQQQSEPGRSGPGRKDGPRCIIRHYDVGASDNRALLRRRRRVRDRSAHLASTEYRSIDFPISRQDPREQVAPAAPVVLVAPPGRI